MEGDSQEPDLNSFVNVQIRILAAQAQAKLAQINAQLAALGTTASNSANGTNRLGQSINNLRLDTMGSRIQWVGRQLEYNFTLPILAAAAAAAKLALDNETAFTRVVKVYGDAAHGADFYGQEIKALQRNFIALSNTYGINQKATLDIAAGWAAAGASGIALAKSVDLTMKTMILGEMDAATATQALIAIQAQYGLSVADLTKVIADLNMVENQTGISLTGLIEGFARSAGVARAAGVDHRHLAAMLAAITPAAGSAAQAGNALKTIFSRLMSPTQEMVEVLGLMHINIDQVGWKSANVTDRLKILTSAFEKLDGAQKNVVSSVIASRWQINKFEVLMRELGKSSIYYQKALDSTSDATAVWAQMNRELQTVLSSNPRRLQIIWTMLQNAAANIIQPMIPMLLYLASAVSTLVQKFSELSPGTQKFIMVSLLLLAAVGPLVRYFGAFAILIAQLGKIFIFFLTPVAKAGALLWWLTTVPVGKFFLGMSFAVKWFAALIGPTLAAGLAAGGRALRSLGWALAGTWRALMFTLWLIQNISVISMAYMWRAMLLTFLLVTVSWRVLIVSAWQKTLALLIITLGRGAALVGIIWRAGLTAMAIFSAAFWRGMLTMATTFFVSGLLPFLRRAMVLVVGALAGPWGVALSTILLLLIAFWDQVKTFVSSVVNGVIAGFNALPEGIRNALISVVRIIAAAAKQAAHWLSYLNPWARHSPSLVDNVTTGVAEIIRQFSTLTNVGPIFQRAGVNINSFGEALANIRKKLAEQDIARLRKDLATFAPSMLGDFDSLMKVVRSMQNEFAKLQASLPVEQMKKWDDAIFKNQMDQKRLRLEMMKMEQAIGPLDKLEGKLQAINGALELLQGEQTSLRDAGAGSDILSQYDDQIKALKDQKTAIDTQIRPLRDMARQLDELGRVAEMLDLEKSLGIDPITRQMDELSSAIDVVKEAMNGMSQAAASAAAGAKHMSPGAANFLASAGGNFPDVGGNAQIGREGGLGDQSKLIDDFTKELADKTKNMFGLFDFLEPVKRGWNTAVTWLKTNIGPGISAFGKAFADGMKGLPNPFGGLKFDSLLSTLKGVGDFIVGIFKDIWTLIGPPIKEIGRILQEAFGKALKEIGPELAKFKDLVGPMQEAFKTMWPVIKIVAGIIGGVLLLAISIIVNVLKNVLVPILNGIIEVVKAVIRIFRGLIEFFIGVFTGDFEMMWTGIKDFFGGIWDLIFGIVRTALGLIWGVIKGVGEGIGSWWNLLWTKIGDWVKERWNDVLVVITTIGRSFVGFFGWIWGMISGYIGWMVQRMVDLVIFIQSIPGRIWRIAGDIGNFFGGIASSIWGHVQGIFRILGDFIGYIWGLPGRIASAAGGLFDGFIRAFRTAINWIIDHWNDFQLTLGGGTILGVSIPSITLRTPDIPRMAQGGLVANQAMAIVGEGRQGFPEYVIPTDPTYRRRALALFAELGDSLGVRDLFGRAEFFKIMDAANSGQRIQFLARGGRLGTSKPMHGAGVISSHTRIIHFHGDLQFPNVKNGSDAEEFLRNLEALVGEE